MEKLIKVNTNRLKGDTSDIQSLISSMEIKLAELKKHSEELGVLCDGSESDTFKKEVSEDINALQRIMGSLRTMNEYESYAGQQYDKCESKVADLVSQIKVR